MTMPEVTNCPSDIYVLSENRVTTITWSEPSFTNLGSGSTQVPLLYRPGKEHLITSTRQTLSLVSNIHLSLYLVF